MNDSKSNFSFPSSLRNNYDAANKRMLGDETTANPNLLKYIGNNGFPKDAYPLGFCEGDCDTDDECMDPYVCFQHEVYANIPGCGARARSRTDFCVNPDHMLLPFEDEVTVKKEVTLGTYVGTEKYIYEGEEYLYCSKTIFSNEERKKFMFWLSNPGSCEKAGVNQVTGEITGDWFGNIDVNEIYIEQVKSTKCIPAEDCNPDLLMENSDMKENYKIKAVSCGTQHKFDLPREFYFCDVWQVALLQKNDLENDLPEEMIVMTVTYGDTFLDLKNPNCPKTPVYSQSDIEKDYFAAGSAQFILQGNITERNATNVCDWDCLDTTTKQMYGCE